MRGVSCVGPLHLENVLSSNDEMGADREATLLHFRAARCSERLIRGWVADACHVAAQELSSVLDRGGCSQYPVLAMCKQRLLDLGLSNDVVDAVLPYIKVRTHCHCFATSPGLAAPA